MAVATSSGEPLPSRSVEPATLAAAADELVETLRSLIRIPSVNPVPADRPEGETEAAAIHRAASVSPAGRSAGTGLTDGIRISDRRVSTSSSDARASVAGSTDRDGRGSPDDVATAISPDSRRGS